MSTEQTATQQTTTEQATQQAPSQNIQPLVFSNHVKTLVLQSVIPANLQKHILTNNDYLAYLETSFKNNYDIYANVINKIKEEKDKLPANPDALLQRLNQCGYSLATYSTLVNLLPDMSQGSELAAPIKMVEGDLPFKYTQAVLEAIQSMPALAKLGEQAKPQRALIYKTLDAVQHYAFRYDFTAYGLPNPMDTTNHNLDEFGTWVSNIRHHFHKYYNAVPLTPEMNGKVIASVAEADWKEVSEYTEEDMRNILEGEQNLQSQNYARAIIAAWLINKFYYTYCADSKLHIEQLLVMTQLANAFISGVYNNIGKSEFTHKEVTCVGELMAHYIGMVSTVMKDEVVEPISDGKRGRPRTSERSAATKSAFKLAYSTWQEACVTIKQKREAKTLELTNKMDELRLEKLEVQQRLERIKLEIDIIKGQRAGISKNPEYQSPQAPKREDYEN